MVGKGFDTLCPEGWLWGREKEEGRGSPRNPVEWLSFLSKEKPFQTTFYRIEYNCLTKTGERFEYMRELLIGTKTAQIDGKHPITCEYKILVQNINTEITCEVYGVQVRLLETGEYSQVLDLTVESARITELGEALCRNAVTPCTLREVIEDWI